MEVPKRKPVPTATHRQNRRSLTWPLIYTALFVGLFSTFPWSRRWLESGAAVETLLLLLGDSNGTRILPIAPTYALVSTINLIYAVASTSWLLYWLFTGTCWPFVLLTCLYQFEFAAEFARGRLRSLLKQLQFAHDKIAIFNVPALEIDTNVTGLFVVRGLTFSLSRLTIIAHGLELGIKVADDIELAIYADEVVISLFRRIDVGHCYANIKGGALEMTFGHLNYEPSKEKTVFDVDTPLLRAASGKDGQLQPPRPPHVRKLTGGRNLEDSSAMAGLESLERLSPDNETAVKNYNATLANISSTSIITQCVEEVRQHLPQNAEQRAADISANDLRAAVCARMHDRPSVPHPPTRSVKVTTLQGLSPPWLRRFLHRLPLLLRLLLGPLAYFHTISIASITAAGSGAWLKQIIHAEVFKQYVDDNAELQRLAKRMESWLAGAHFVLELVDISATAQVPIDPMYHIKTSLEFSDVMMYRAVLESNAVRQVMCLGGANATFTVPSFLLPHHEHLIPHRPNLESIDRQIEEVHEADGKPKTKQAQKDLEQTEKDVASIAMSVHASLPMCLDQELINFAAAFVKAAKVIEIERTGDDEVSSGDDQLPDSPVQPSSATSQRFSSLMQSVKQTTQEGVKATRDGMKRAFVGGVVNDRWIAKMVGKIAARLENAQGDAGYTGGIPVPLEPYRTGFNTNTDSKLLP